MRDKRTVLVVGGGSGIGAAVALEFASLGDHVVVADLEVTAAEAVAAQLREDFDLEAEARHIDVTDEASVDACFNAFFGSGIDVVVNAAGIYPNTPIMQLSLAEWSHVQQVNLTGTFLVARAAARAMVERTAAQTARGSVGRGRIIMISSGAAQSARVGAAHYCSSKTGVEMVTRVLALELGGTGVTVNAVAPGLILVDRVANLAASYVDELVEGLPIRRMGKPHEVAGVCRFLASPDADYMTGSVVAVDGGFAAGRALPASTPRAASHVAAEGNKPHPHEQPHIQASEKEYEDDSKR